MKRVMMAAAAMFIAGSMAAATVPTECTCLQVYDFKASIKNSMIGQKYDKKCGIGYCYKYIQSNTLGGYLVTACSDCCQQGPDGYGRLYLTRSSDKAKRLFRVDEVSLSADQFWTKLVDCETGMFPAGSADAEGVLGFIALDNELNTFFTDDDDPVIDVGNKAFLATGFGKAITKSIYDPYMCQSYTCSVLDNLSGSIVGLMGLGTVCNNFPYEVLCTGISDQEGWAFSNKYGFNAVVTGTWSIKRTTDRKILSSDCNSKEVENNIIEKYPNYRFNPLNAD
jgi:hypothetical protein